MSNSNTTEVSVKNTKNEILDAYNALLAKVQGSKTESRQQMKLQQEETEVVKKATSLNSEKIAKNILELKLTAAQELDALEQKMSTELRRLIDVQAAIKIESQNLQDLYEIKKNADSLAALLLAQKEYKQVFELQKEEQRELWEREQREFDQKMKEQQDRVKKERSREEEEYIYNLTLERKKDNDAYDAQKIMAEKELSERKVLFEKGVAEREGALKAKEEEFQVLQKRVGSFAQELEKAVKDAEKSTREAIEMRYKHQIDLYTKEIDGERKLNQQIIVSLQEKIKEQDEYIKQLTQKANDSTKQVQSIALKALESTSNVRFVGGYSEEKKQSTTSL